jgi:hypothetical protein
MMTARTEYPRLNELLHTVILNTFGLRIISKAGEVDKPGICATACTIASQWLTIFIITTSIKANVAHPVIARGL